ncbi:radical SAM protein [Magnetovibrio sp.]|uniref:radical SAM protein n=1 Tax=Magnetovibrio sp. TaxID=2024836 RepID=UPI002F932695
MPEGAHDFVPLDPLKFRDPLTTAKGEMRASVALHALETLWFNTGSLCNITCGHCYMNSSPSNDDLLYLSRDHVRAYLDEIASEGLTVAEIGFTGGEPFMNRDLAGMLDDVLERGFRALVLTNAMKPLWQKRQELLSLKERHDTARLKLRVSIDHHSIAGHEQERGAGTWAPMERGVKWLLQHGFSIDVAGRTMWAETQDDARQGYQHLFDAWGLGLDANDPSRLVLFPEMDDSRDVPEITTQCWSILNVRPDAMMCARSRMVVHRKGTAAPTVVPCTLLPYDPRFDMGRRLVDAGGAVPLNHPHCAKFCVLGGASCSA